jgi:integrase
MLKPGEVHIREIGPGTDKFDRGYRAVATFRAKKKRKTKYFASLRQAKLWATQWQAQVMASGAATPLSVEEVAAVASARAEIAALKSTLSEVIDAGLPIVRARRLGISVANLADLRINNMRSQGGSKAHLANSIARLHKFAQAFGSRSAALLSTAEIDAWLTALPCSPRTRFNFRDSISAMYANGIRLGLLEQNPVVRTLRPILRQGKIAIFTLPQVRTLLRIAPTVNGLGYVVLGLFAGLRSSETMRLKPTDFGPGWVRIEYGKTRGSRRVVRLNETALAWLPADPLADHGDKRRIKLHAAMPFPWPINGLRHSFASYHLAHFRDLTTLAADMGSSPAVVRRDYAELVSPADAAEFWALRPTDSTTE